VYATPVVAGDLVFVGSCSGVFAAYECETGSIRWSYDTGQDSESAQFHGDPLVVGEMVIVGSDSVEPSYTYAFDRDTGKLIWRREQDSIESDVLAVGKNAIGQNWNGDLVALSFETGELAWKVSAEETIFPHRRGVSPTERAGTLYFAGTDGKVYAVDGEEGAVLWKTGLECGINTTPVAGEAGVYVGGEDGIIYRLSLSVGEVTATYPSGLQPLGQPVLVDDRLVVLLDERRVAAVAGDLDGVLWDRVAEEEWTSYQPLVWNETVIVGESKGSVHAFRLTDGSTAWTAKVEGKVRGLGADGNVLYIGVLQGGLTAFAVGADP
jgi:outer membrane protein assembly factor BamB